MRLIDVNEAVINFGFEYDDIAPTPEEFIAFLKRQPVVEAEIVTRCKDCGNYLLYTDGRPMNFCTVHKCDMYDDTFCSYGAQKEVKQ